eukprot:COSAG01_NODE_2108_length_8408_cov_138.235768_13_plen_79_part_01
MPVLPGDTPNTLHRGTPLIAAGSAAAASTQRSSSDIVEQRSQNVNSGGQLSTTRFAHARAVVTPAAAQAGGGWYLRVDG